MPRVSIAVVVAIVVLSAVPAAGVTSPQTANDFLASSPSVDVGASAPLVEPQAAPLGVSDDLTVSDTNVTTLTGMVVDFTATVGGVAPSQIEWWWGDGTTSTVSSNPASHAYANPGIYLIYAEGTDSTGGLHDNLGSLLRLAVLDSYTNDLLGNETQIQGSVLANESSTSGAQAVIAPGGWIQVSNWVTNLPNNPQWTLEAPTYNIGATARPYTNISTILGDGLNLSGATLSWTNTTPQGSYTLNFSVQDVNPEISPEGHTWNNFTFTVFVSPSGATPLSPLPTSPHNGTLQVYQVQTVPPQSVTLDPAFAEDPTDGPILQNFYQTLIVYNGSQAGPSPSDFVPDLATCVPGSSQCDSLYGTSLVSGTNWTFVINPNATFYNGSTGATWSVYPNDVAFSLARSCLMANSPFGVEDFQLCQILLPDNANGGWDGGIHSPWNNTPSQILTAISLNNSRYCTAQMQDGVHGQGCITIDTSASGKAWPELLEFVESTVGAAVISCDWAASENLGLPGWTDGSTCYPAPPGSVGNPNPLPSDTAWDGYELNNGYNGFPTSALRFHALGSGPYYLTGFDNVTGYTLSANPAWGGTTCRGGAVEGCLPDATVGGHAPSYIPNVVIHFELSNGPGLSAMAAGDADLIDTSGGGGNAGYGGNGTTILAEVEAGQLDYIVGPSVTEDYTFTEPEFNVSAASSALGSSVTLPSDAFQDLNFRQFLIASYPHLTTEQNDCIVGGILYCFSTGGAIPVGMGSYYPTNISWPLTNADPNPQDVDGAAWWWSQVAADSMVGNVCTAASPCTFPMPAVDPTQTVDYQAWAQAMDSISGGAIRPSVVSVTFGDMIQTTWLSALGNATFPMGGWAWAPDYFDPSDYTDPFYPSNGYVSVPLHLSLYLLQPQYTSACSGSSSDPVVTTACQGTAYNELNTLVQSADDCAPPSCSESQRALLYNMAERVADGLGLYTTVYQQAAVYAFAPWIDASSLLLNPDRNNVYGGTTSDQPFFFIQYATGIPQGYALRVYLETPGSSPSTSIAPALSGPHGAENPSGTLTVEAGEAFLTLVSVVGGSGEYNYVWNGLPAGCATMNSAVFSCRPSEGGNVSMNVTVIDSKGARGASNSLPITVVPHVNISSFGVSPASVILGNPVSFTLHAEGGIGSLSYAYSGLPTGCASSDTSAFSCTPTSVGHYSITASATDSVGLVALSVLELNVTQAATASHPTSLGLPGNDGYYLVAGLLLAAILIAVGIRRMRRPAQRSGEGSPPSSVGPRESGGSQMGGAPPTMSPSRISSEEMAGRAGPSESGAPATGFTSTPAPDASTRLEACPACGAQNRVGAKYCDQCAKPLVR